ncbi:DOPA 4,5-dioxygenase family protein [Burkholderia sp. WSM2230]|uniref:DOPA 4,5-dioxygenase family protein n=1 Tax=Burkholderia sp. WSM2230 TaxID=944435 RepID=UPI000417787A|nr:DOPA 4,5-dioxygenase family protein [Burkholderia sp. WSM2230]
MTPRHISAIHSWHAHVYFDAATRDQAWAFREQIEAHWQGKLQMGRFHERPVGPHPMWSYQLGFAHEQFGDLIAWLTLNHGALDIFVHPNTGDALRDHRDAAVWIGRSHELVLDALI